MPRARSQSCSVSPPPLKRRRLTTPPNLLADPLISVTSTDCSLSLPRTSNTLRIISWNINGIDAFRPSRPRDQKAITTFFSPTKPSSPRKSTGNGNKTDRPSLRRSLRRWGWPQVVCLQEVKVSRSDRKTQDVVRRLANKHESSDDEDSDVESTEDSSLEAKSEDEQGKLEYSYTVHFNLPHDTHNARGPHGNGKVYGVCTLVRQDILSPRKTIPETDVITKDVPWDLEGRVLITEIPSPSTTPITTPATPIQGLAIFNIYAVNGTTLPYHDPSTGSISGDRHSHKRRFHAHLARSVHEYHQRGWQTVIAGDLNIARDPIDSYPALRTGEEHVQNRADFEAKIMGLGMVDTFRYLHGQTRKYTYRPRGKPWGAGMDRVDLVLCDGRMVERANGGKRKQGWRLVGGDILDTEVERGPSDHVPLYVDVDFGALGDGGVG